MTEQISAAFPFESNYVDVLGSKMHYVEQGQGDPILFIHGIPTSSYLWRNIMPSLSKQGRCIAVDLIGLGKSDKPDIEYSVFDHIKYLDGFIQALGLKKVTLVMHAWGSVIGFHYAMQHQDNIKALAFLESHIRRPTDHEMVSLPLHEVTSIMDSDDGGYAVIMNSNYYVNKVLPSGVLRKLSNEEMQHYQEPFTQPGSCKPIWQYLQEVFIGDGSSPARDIIDDYSAKLEQSDVPKLMLYAVPGFITTIDTVQWAKQSLPNIELVDIGDALHYAQESKPDVIADELSKWYAKVNQTVTA